MPIPSPSLIEMTAFLEKLSQPTVFEQTLERFPGNPRLKAPVMGLAGLAGLVLQGPRNIYSREYLPSLWKEMAGKGFHPR